MTPSPSVDPTSKINELAADPDFLKLSDGEQKFILQKVRGATPTQGTQSPVPSSGVLGKVAGRGTSYNPTPEKDDRAIDFLRPLVAGTAGHLAGAATAATVAGAPAAIPADIGSYAIVDSLMQYLKHNSPDSYADALKTGAADGTANFVGGKLGQKVFGAGKAFLIADQPEIYKFLPTASQAIKSEVGGRSLIGTASKALEDLAVSAKSEALDRSAGAGFTQALQVAKRNNFDQLTNGQFSFSLNPNTALRKVNEQVGGTNPTDALLSNIRGTPAGADTYETLGKLNAVIDDPKKLQSVLSTAQANGINTNLKKTLQGYQFQRMLNDATTTDLTGNATRIDPDKISKVWGSSEMQDSIKALYNSRQRADITQFFTNIENTQDKISVNPVARKFWMLHGAVGLSMGFFTHGVSGAALGAAAGSATGIGVLLSAESLGKLLTDPKTARIMVSLAGGEALNSSEQYAGKVISQVLQGSTLALMGSDGKRTPVVLEDNKFKPLGQ